MGIHSIPNMCSHLQNACRARLGLTSIPSTKYNLGLSLALHRAGYISSVTRGGPHPPDPETAATTPPEPVTHANVATRRLWLGLKYHEGRPVMSTIQNVSTSKRWVNMNLASLRRVTRGLSAGSFKGLELGESLFLTTDVGVLEAREALERNRGGLLLCRVKGW